MNIYFENSNNIKNELSNPFNLRNNKLERNKSNLTNNSDYSHSKKDNFHFLDNNTNNCKNESLHSEMINL